MTSFPIEPDRDSHIPSEAAEGERIGKYIKTRKLGAGGMGEVWKAWDIEIRRWVALKFLKHEDAADLARFRREAQMAGQLHHPNIAAIHEVGEAAGKPFIAMQYVEGETLATFPRNDRKLVVRLVRDAALAVHAAHEQGVIHRDLKPDNLLVEAAGRTGTRQVFVMDFGLAKPMKLDSSLSQSGFTVGTPAYMSPEQAQGKKEELGPPSDVYSLGATLYELLTDQPPFREPEVFETMRRIVQEDPMPVRALNPRIDADLETIVMRCLEKEPARRYASALELAEDLTNYLEGGAIQAHPPTVTYRLSKFVARRKVVVGLAAMIALAAAVIGVLAPQWLKERRERAAEQDRLKQKENELAAERERERQEENRRDAARPYLKEGDVFIEEMRLRLRHPDYSFDELTTLATHAEDQYRRALKEHGNDPEAWLGIGRAWRIAGNEEKAYEALKRAIAASPTFSTAYLERVRMRLTTYAEMMHETTGAQREETAQSAKIRQEIEGDLDQVERCTRQAPEKLLAEGLLHFARGAYRESSEALSRYSEGRPGEPEAHFWRGLSLHLLRDDVPAIEALTRCLECDARHTWAWLNRGSAKRNLKDIDGALADFDRALEIQRDLPEGYFNRANAKQAKQDLVGAIADYDRAVAIRKDYADAYNNRGVAKRDQGDLAGALEDYNRALAIKKDFAEAYLNRGNVKTSMRELDEAIADYDRVLGIKKDYAEAYGARGFARQSKGDVEGAIADYRKALEVAPENWVYRAQTQRILEAALRGTEK